MATKLTCPHCGQHLELEEGVGALLGHELGCPACQQAFAVTLATIRLGPSAGAQPAATPPAASRGKSHVSKQMRLRLEALGVPHVVGRSTPEAQALLLDLARQGRIKPEDADQPWRLDAARPEDLARLAAIGGSWTGVPPRGTVEDAIARHELALPITAEEQQWMRELGYQPTPGMTKDDLHRWFATRCPPSPAQLAYLRSVGGKVEHYMTSVEAELQLNQLVPVAQPTERQLAFIAELHGHLDCAATRAEASQFIDYLLDHRGQLVERYASHLFKRPHVHHQAAGAPAPTSGSGCLGLVLLLSGCGVLAALHGGH